MTKRCCSRPEAKVIGSKKSLGDCLRQRRRVLVDGGVPEKWEAAGPAASTRSADRLGIRAAVVAAGVDPARCLWRQKFAQCRIAGLWCTRAASAVLPTGCSGVDPWSLLRPNCSRRSNWRRHCYRVSPGLVRPSQVAGWHLARVTNGVVDIGRMVPPVRAVSMIREINSSPAGFQAELRQLRVIQKHSKPTLHPPGPEVRRPNGGSADAGVDGDDVLKVVGMVGVFLRATGQQRTQP